MNIARFTFSLALISSVVTPAVAHKDGCSHGCKHESLHPTKTKKATTHTEAESDAKKEPVVKKVEITEPVLVTEVKTVVAQEAEQRIAEPVTNSTVSTPIELAAAPAVTPAQPAPALEVAQAPAVKEEIAAEVETKTVELKQEAEVTVVAVTEEKNDQATQELSQEERKERRLLLADATPEDLAAIEDIAALLDEDELTLSSAHDAQPKAEIKTAAAPAPEAQDAQENINNLTQVMI